MYNDKRRAMQLVAQNLRKYRDERDLTQEEVAERAGISVAFLANIERGCKIMSVPVLRSLADSLGVSADYLLYEDSGDKLNNINALLRDQPEAFIIQLERVIRLLIEEFSQDHN